MWLNFLEYFNGKTLWQQAFITDTEVCLATDAAGSVGFGAIWNSHWCASSWHLRWVKNVFWKNIVLLELFPVIVSVEIWGSQIANRRIL